MRSRLAALWLTAALAGCALGPDYKAPAPPAGSAAPFVAASPVATSGQAPPDAWWELYDDPELNRLVLQAFAANTDLRSAEADLAAARAVYEGARADLLPQTQTGFGAIYGRDANTDEILEISGAKPRTVWVDDAIIDASYELDLFGHVRRSIEAAHDSAQAVQAALDDLRVTIAAETARAYGQICTLGEQIAVAERSLALVQRQARIVAQRLDAGAGSQYDLVRAQVLVAQQQAALPPLQGARKAMLYELADLLGETPAQAPAAAAQCVAAPRLDRVMPVGDGAMLLRRRPDIREADRNFAAALARQGVATADLFPRVTLTGLYGGAASEPRQLFSNSGLTWGVGPQISWSFPNLAAPLAQLAQAKANVRAELWDYDSVTLKALMETEQALAQYGAELDHHAALVTARDEARHEYRLAEDAFAAGQISNLDVLTSEQTEVGAEAVVAASDADLVQDQIAVFKALGGGWQ